MADEERQVGIRITGTNETRPDFEQVRTDLEKTGASARQASAEYRSMAVAAQQNASSHGVLFADLKRVNDLARDFGGGKAFKSAEEYAGAVQKIGGAAKLTATEQATVHREVSTAIDKYRALGQQAPAHLIALQKETSKVTAGTAQATSSFGQMFTSLKGVAGLFGVTFGVGAVVAFTGRVFDAASAIKDQSTALGFSAEAYQRYSYATKMAGGTQEDFVRGASLLNDALSEGKASTVKALQRAGLEFETIRAMKPERAFAAVTAAVGGMVDPFQRAEVARDLFGRGSLSMLPAMIEGYEKLGASAKVMSDKTIDDLERAQDAWDDLWDKIVTVSGGVVAGVMNFGQPADAVRQAAELARKETGLSLGLQIRMINLMNGPEREAFIAKYARQAALAAEATAAQEQEAARRAALAEKEEADSKRLEEERARRAKRQQESYDAMFGLDVIARAKALAETLGAVDNIAQLSTDRQRELFRATDDALAAYQRLGIAAPAQIHRIHAALDPVVGSIRQMTLELNKLVSTDLSMKAVGLPALQILRNNTRQPPAAPATFDLRTTSVLGSLPVQKLGARLPGPMLSPDVLTAPDRSPFQTLFGMTGEQFGQSVSATMVQAVAGGGNIGEAAGSMIGQSMGAHLAKAAGQQTTGFFTTGLGGIVSAALPGLGALLGPLAGKLSGWVVGLFTGGEGAKANDLRDSLKKEIAASIKGLENHPDIRNAMNRFNTAGSREDVQAAFDEATAAADRARETMERYGLSLDDLKSPHERLSAAMLTLGDDFRELRALGFGDEAIARASADGLNELVRSALDAGGKIPVAFQPLIEQLIKSGGLADDVKNRLLGIETARAPWQDMEAIAKEFNIDLGAMGPAFQQSKLIEGATTLADKWKLLVDNGADVGAVIEGMKGPANEFLHNALRWGLEVPPSMRPMLEAMQKAGELTDENGDKLENLDNVKFGKTVAEQFDPLVDALRDLIDVFAVDLPGSLDTLRRNASQGITVPVDIDARQRDQSGNSNPDDPHRNQTDHSGTEPEPPGLARGGLVEWPTTARIAEGGSPEIVGDQGFMTKAVAAALRQVMGQAGSSVAASSAQTFQVTIPVTIGNHHVETLIVDVTSTAMAQGRIPVPSRSVNARVSRG